MLDGFDLDPYNVLGLAPGASAEAIRDAFRRQSLKHHPDRGGDDWAFRLVVRAYQTLSEPPPAAEPPGIPSSPVRRVRPAVVPEDLDRGDTTRMAPPVGSRWGPIRQGVVDHGVEKGRLVLVEIVWTQHEVNSVLSILNGKSEDRHVSGSLSLTWPDPQLPDDPRGLPFADRILLALNAAFDELRSRRFVRSARSHIESGRFEAWLEYPSGPLARDAFKHLHSSLRARGLGVQQWTRVLTVPRESQP